MKKRLTALVSAAMVLGLACTAQAAGWKTGTYRSNDWRYIKPNGSFACGWEVIDSDGDGIGNYYFFDQGGWLKTDGETPDGYTVNENGEWVVDGVVQTVDMAEVQEKENNLSDMPSGDYYLSYLVYNYGQMVGTLDKTVESSVSLDSYTKNVITLMYRVERIDGTVIYYPMEFERQKDGTYAYVEGESRTTLTWDVASRNFTTDDEERYCVYDLRTTGASFSR